MKSEHGDTLMTIILILLAVIILTVFPLLIIADNAEDTIGSTLQVQLDEATAEISQKRVLTIEYYSKLVEKISNPNSYDVTLKIDKLDENVGKKTIQVNSKVLGENVYVTMYHSQIMDILLNGSGKIDLNSGDSITITAVSKNQSVSGQLTRQNAAIPEHSASSTKTVN